MKAENLKTLGTALPRGPYTPERSVIGEVAGTANGNVVLRVGRTVRGGTSWQQTEHVVLTQAEAEDLTCRLAEAIWS